MSTARPFDPSVYLVTDTAMCGARGVVATAAAAVAAGVRLVQLRDPDASDAEFVRLGRAVADELGGTGAALVVNDRVHLVAAIGADGAHVGQDDLGVAESRALLGPHALLGLSVQTLTHVAQARERGDDIDYLGVGPVWAQHTKPDGANPCGPDGLRAIVATSPWPCVAIGGVDAQRIVQVRAAGAVGGAVVSAICAAPDPRAAAADLVASWRSGTPAPPVRAGAGP